MLATQSNAAARQQSSCSLPAARPGAGQRRVEAPRGLRQLRTSPGRRLTRVQYAAALYSSVDSSMGLGLGLNAFTLVVAAVAAYWFTRKDQSEVCTHFSTTASG